MGVINKEDFVKAIEDVKCSYKYQDNLNAFFKKNGVEGSIYQPDCATTTLRLLHIMFEDADVDDYISRFCIDLDFGKKWEKGCVRDVHGQSVDLSTAESLYDYLKAVI